LEFEPRIQGESSLQLLAGGLHAQAAVAFRHLVQRAGQRNEQGTAEQQEQKGGEGWSKPRGTAGVVVELGALVADLFHWFGGRRPPKGPGRSDAGTQFGLDHFDDGHQAVFPCGVVGSDCLGTHFEGVVHQDQGGDGLAAFGGPEVHWGGWN